jgi:hypothetical protein
MADQFNRYRCAHCDWEATVGHAVKHYSKTHSKNISVETINGKQIAVFHIHSVDNGNVKPSYKVQCCLACRKFWKNDKTMMAHFAKCENYAIHERLLKHIIESNTPPQTKQTIAENVIVQQDTDTESELDFWKQEAKEWKMCYDTLNAKYDKLIHTYIPSLLEKIK